MAKNNTYEVKDYDAYQHASAISNDLNKQAGAGWEVYQIMSIPQSYEVSRYPAETPGLNDGDSVTFVTTMRVVYRK